MQADICDFETPTCFKPLLADTLISSPIETRSHNSDHSDPKPRQSTPSRHDSHAFVIHTCPYSPALSRRRLHSYRIRSPPLEQELPSTPMKAPIPKLRSLQQCSCTVLYTPFKRHAIRCVHHHHHHEKSPLSRHLPPPPPPSHIFILPPPLNSATSTSRQDPLPPSDPIESSAHHAAVSTTHAKRCNKKKKQPPPTQRLALPRLHDAVIVHSVEKLAERIIDNSPKDRTPYH